jgi:hypothetical protein
MKPRQLSLLLICVTLTACDLSSWRQQRVSAQQSQFDAQTVEYERQLKLGAERAQEADRMLKRQMAIIELSEQQAQRMLALTTKWEEQAKRYDAILSRWEQQPAPSAPQK